MADDFEAKLAAIFRQMENRENRAAEEVPPLIYGELLRLATSVLKRKGAGQTLQPTELVNEAYLGLCQLDFKPQSLEHFFGLAAALMRRILANHARQSKRRLAQ